MEQEYNNRAENFQFLGSSPFFELDRILLDRLRRLSVPP